MYYFNLFCDFSVHIGSVIGILDFNVNFSTCV